MIAGWAVEDLLGGAAMNPESMTIAGAVLSIAGIVLRLLFSRWAPRGKSKWAVPDTELSPPIASRWFSPRALETGAFASVALLLIGAGLLLWGLVTSA